MKVMHMLMIAIMSLFIGCGSSGDESELNIDDINAIQEKLAMEVSAVDVVSLPEAVRDNSVSKYGDEGYDNEN